MKRKTIIYLLFMILGLSAAAAWGGNLTKGDSAGKYLTTGDNNAFFGDLAGEFAGSGSSNVYIGEFTGTCITGSYNTAIGEGALAEPDGGACAQKATGSRNTAAGYNAGLVLTSGTDNVFVGFAAGESNSTASYNTFVGSVAGAATTTGGINTFIGNNAGGANTVGYRNTFIGNSTGSYNVSGHNNIFIGDHAGGPETGSYRLYIDVTNTATPLMYGEFDNNKVVINGSLLVTGGIVTTAGPSSDTFLGTDAGSNTTGVIGSNTFIGQGAGFYNASGYSNTYLGTGAGFNSTGHGNVFIGFSAGDMEATGSNKLYIDNGYGSAPLIYGEFDNKLVQINGTLVMSSDERLKNNIEPLRSSLEKILKIRGVSYEWKDSEGDRGFGGAQDIGVIAQEVEKFLPELVYTDSLGFKAVAYDKLFPVLVEAVKEQQTIISGQRENINEKLSRIQKLREALAAQERIIAAQGKELSSVAARLAVSDDHRVFAKSKSRIRTAFLKTPDDKAVRPGGF